MRNKLILTTAFIIFIVIIIAFLLIPSAAKLTSTANLVADPSPFIWFTPIFIIVVAIILFSTKKIGDMHLENRGV